MPIISVNVNALGMSGVVPKIIFIDTNDNLAEILTTGYLNHLVAEGIPISTSEAVLITFRPTPSSHLIEVALLNVIFSNGDWSLDSVGGPGSIDLPTIANHIATYVNAQGELSEDPAIAISGGSIQAGLSGTAGSLISFPASALKGSLHITGVANTGDTLVTVSNAAHGQASVYTIPDGAQAASNFIISNSSGTQIIATGSFDVAQGNVTAGSSGHAGLLASFPAAGSKGSLEVVAVANTGDTLVTISNAAHGQASVYSIPDSGAATANFIVSALSGTQHITSGGFQVDQGNVIAGSSGHAGLLASFPSTSARGSFEIVAVANAGDTLVTLSNDSHAQASVYNIPDVGNAIGQVLVGASATPFTTAHILASSGTVGVVADSGIPTASVQLSTNIKAATTGNIGGAGAGPITVTVAGLTTSSVVVATVETSSNPVSVLNATAGTGNFAVIFSADPGASCTLNYVAFIAAQ